MNNDFSKMLDLVARNGLAESLILAHAIILLKSLSVSEDKSERVNCAKRELAQYFGVGGTTNNMFTALKTLLLSNCSDLENVHKKCRQMSAENQITFVVEFLKTFCDRSQGRLLITNSRKQYYPLAKPEYAGMDWKGMEDKIALDHQLRQTAKAAALNVLLQ